MFCATEEFPKVTFRVTEKSAAPFLSTVLSEDLLKEATVGRIIRTFIQHPNDEFRQTMVCDDKSCNGLPSCCV